MDFSRPEKRGIASVLVGALLVVFGFFALAGLSRLAFITALVAALFASAIVISAIVFHAAYRRANSPRAFRRTDYSDEWLDSEEGLEERPELPWRTTRRDEERRPRP